VQPVSLIRALIPARSKKRLLAALLPQDCVLCGTPESVQSPSPGKSALLCRDCLAGLPYLPVHRCPVCALPTPGSAICGRCLAAPPHFDGTHAALAYRYPFEPLLHQYKYRGAVAIGALFSELLHETLVGRGTRGADLITVIPLSRERLVERGFNQALEIARPLAKSHGLQLRADLGHRVRHTGTQADLPFAQRRKNVRNAFACVEDLSGLRVAVVDDVMTTGATLDEFARTLKRRGAASVENWVVGRALLKD
jgi:ComF family protein